MRTKEEHLMNGGNMKDKIFTWGHSACNMAIVKACKKLGFPEYNCHESSDEVMVLTALENV